MGYLSEDFLASYKDIKPNWGFQSGPNSLGEITYRRTYSRDGEAWWETCRRAVEGTYEIIEAHVTRYNIPFDMDTAIHDAQEMYHLMFNFKFLPGGRGLWAMGSKYVKERNTVAPLINCTAVTTANIDKDYEKAFTYLMDMSMLGCGTGFDVRGAGKIAWHPNMKFTSQIYIIEDSREGWVNSTGELLRWGFGLRGKPIFNYSNIRKNGAKIKGFGGVAPGPELLITLHNQLSAMAMNNDGEKITSRDIVDIMNMIGVCVVSGGVRRTAEIAFGDPDDDIFMSLKDYKKYPERADYGWTSNNSVFAEVGMDYSRFVDNIAESGEPGFFWIENARKYGRMIDGETNSDPRIVLLNPCGEISLEDKETCNLVELFPFHHETIEEFDNTIKYAFIYAKAVTLLPSHWKETNAVTMRNRRIGTSMSGVAQFISYRGKREFTRWCKEGYKTIRKYDKIYSEWLGIRESIKVSTVKPSGTTSLLCGATPGAHYPTYRHYIRRIRFTEGHPDLQSFIDAGYRVEQAIREPNTVVVEFPVKGDPKVPTEREVSLGEKISIAVSLQKNWSDNGVSMTATFNPETEKHLIPDFLSAYDSQLKAISFLPLAEQSQYDQLPYEPITEEQYDEMVAGLKEIKWAVPSVHDMEDKFCDGNSCELKL